VQGPVDWDLAERVARRFIDRSGPAESDPTLDASFAQVVERAEHLVTIETGLTSLHGPARARVVDRAEWVAVNIRSLRRLLAPLLQRWEEHGFEERGITGRMSARVTRSTSGVELGVLLGWMSCRVLGQYDVLVGQGPVPPGRHPVSDAQEDAVYVVGPNLVALERRLGFPADQFRLWVALHEVTHRAQFTGVAWMREYFLGLMHDAVALADADPTQVAAALKIIVTNRDEAGARLRDGGLLGLLASDDQRGTLDQIGGLMALLEGHGDVTMDRAGVDQIPLAPRFSRALRPRRTQASPLARVVQRLIGLEAKLNQYELGERFVEAIELAVGTDAVTHCWTEPSALPSLVEIREPDRWLARMGLGSCVA
jgi:coenzyme F420 biosynthesis associated uncharacterized protein